MVKAKIFVFAPKLPHYSYCYNLIIVVQMVYQTDLLFFLLLCYQDLFLFGNHKNLIYLHLVPS